MGFDAIDSVEPTQVLELTANDFAENNATALRFVKFQYVTTLSVRLLSYLTVGFRK
jgi:hypothetical protein